jgi:hypothetical protein
MSLPARITPVLEDLERQEILCRRLGCHDLADKIAERLCHRMGEYFQQPVQVEKVTRVGIYKGGL